MESLDFLAHVRTISIAFLWCFHAEEAVHAGKRAKAQSLGAQCWRTCMGRQHVFLLNPGHQNLGGKRDGDGNTGDLGKHLGPISSSLAKPAGTMSGLEDVTGSSVVPLDLAGQAVGAGTEGRGASPAAQSRVHACPEALLISKRWTGRPRPVSGQP